MIISAYSKIGPFYDVIDSRTGEKIKGAQWADSKKFKLLILKPNTDPKSQDEYSVDKNGRYETIEIYKDFELVRNTSYLGIVKYLIIDFVVGIRNYITTLYFKIKYGRK